MQIRTKIVLALILFEFHSIALHAQSAFIPIGSESVHMLERLEIKSGRLAEPLEFNASSQSYKRSSIASYVDSFDVSHTSLSKQDYFNLDYLQNDNFEFSKSENTKSIKPLFGNTIYKHKSAFFDVTSTDFNLVVNPVAYLDYGYDTKLQHNVSLNNRGIEIRGSIKNVLGFYTQVSDEVIGPNIWVTNYYQRDSVIPGAGLLKMENWQSNRTIDYFLASGYITLQASKYIDIQFGHGKNFLGNGFRTFYMSDFSVDHLFLRINTKVWKIHYTNIFGEVLDYVYPHEPTLPARHYYATTYANINFTKKFNLGLFQTIIFQRDSGYANGGFDPQYLNPIILYKPIENNLNSPDKALLGSDFKYNFAKHFSLYGQCVISEFIISEVIANKGFWANKQAYQLGLKYIDAFTVNNLDLQFEFNQANPYMYSSFSKLDTWVNYRQDMAHPLGANFMEFISVVRYQPMNRLFLKGTFIIALYGEDTPGISNSNWGKNIGLSYLVHPQDYGNYVGQGITTHLYKFDIAASYMLKHNLFLTFQLTYRKTSSVSFSDFYDSETVVGSVGIRWNIAERRYDF